VNETQKWAMSKKKLRITGLDDSGANILAMVTYIPADTRYSKNHYFRIHGGSQSANLSKPQDHFFRNHNTF
jgi:hypothetical protein